MGGKSGRVGVRGDEKRNMDVRESGAEVQVRERGRGVYQFPRLTILLF